METAGHLVSSTDESFSVFKGIEGLPKDKKRIFKKTKSQETEAEFGGQKIILDTMWKQSMENLWLLEDFAILSMTTMSVPEEQKNHAMDTLLRRLCQSTDLSYSIAPQRKITINENKISVMNIFYQPESENVTRDFKIITQNKGNGTISLLTLTIFDYYCLDSRRTSVKGDYNCSVYVRKTEATLQKFLKATKFPTRTKNCCGSAECQSKRLRCPDILSFRRPPKTEHFQQ